MRGETGSRDCGDSLFFQSTVSARLPRGLQEGSGRAAGGQRAGSGRAGIGMKMT